MHGSLRVLMVSPLLATFFASVSLAATSEDSLSADQWHAKAMAATLEANLEDRQSALDAAIEVDPDHEPSRAERGEVFADGRWITAKYAQFLAAEDPARDEYRRRLAELADTPASHARLAKWCDRSGLADEARPHWLAVLQSDPKNRAALTALNAVWREGLLWDADLAMAADERAEEQADQAKSWEKRFTRFETRRYLDKEDLESIREELNPDAILPIERRIALVSSQPEAPIAERARLLANAYLEAAASMPETEVTASLCRVSVLAGDEFQGLAIDSLKDRPEADSMPMLLSYLIAPIDSEHQIRRDAQGNVLYEHRLKQEGAERDLQHERNRQANVAVDLRMVRQPGYRSVMTNEAVQLAQIQARFEGLKNEIAFRTEAAETDQLVAEANAIATRRNSRVKAALESVSGRSLGDEPREWWDYWQRYSGYDSYNRPVEKTYDVTYTTETVSADTTLIRLPPPPPPRRHECFVAGTPVWTREGQRAIETLQPGDLVLARHPHRGGLTFRAVTATTLRELSPMVEIVAGDDTIHATEGHPFWVVGQGWRMAKQLSEGDILSTVEGPVTVAAVTDHGSLPAHNLVVEGAANYYVGQQGVLVHDNTPRLPAVGLVAGR